MFTVEFQGLSGCDSADAAERGVVRMSLAVRAVLMNAACAVVTLTGCSVSVETQEDPTISRENLEQGIADAVDTAMPG
jgi:hypothetical protein